MPDCDPFPTKPISLRLSHTRVRDLGDRSQMRRDTAELTIYAPHAPQPLPITNADWLNAASHRHWPYSSQFNSTMLPAAYCSNSAFHLPRTEIRPQMRNCMKTADMSWQPGLMPMYDADLSHYCHDREAESWSDQIKRARVGSFFSRVNSPPGNLNVPTRYTLIGMACLAIND